MALLKSEKAWGSILQSHQQTVSCYLWTARQTGIRLAKTEVGWHWAQLIWSMTLQLQAQVVWFFCLLMHYYLFIFPFSFVQVKTLSRVPWRGHSSPKFWHVIQKMWSGTHSTRMLLTWYVDCDFWRNDRQRIKEAMDSIKITAGRAQWDHF